MNAYNGPDSLISDWVSFAALLEGFIAQRMAEQTGEAVELTVHEKGILQNAFLNCVGNAAEALVAARIEAARAILDGAANG